ncbi:MAG: serine/threonine protein kinase [Polyangiaceae bacterium]|nr:serine/threonine protein kinase [Polyangiaceae bacterium]
MFAEGDTIAEKYVVERILGEGGMGVVVSARHTLLGERVAIKVLSAGGEAGHARLLREARAAARLRSDHVVRVLDVLELPDARLAIVLEHVDGVTLADELRARGALPPDEAVSYLLEAAHGVAEAHARGIVHRDLKPSNLLLAPLPDGRRRARVIDFGIAKLADDSLDPLTRSDALLGSPAYMSPEQIRDPRDVDARADIWSLGVVLYELLSGALPFEGFTTSGLLARIVADPPVDLATRRPDLPPELLDAVRACLARDPALRPPDVATLAARLAPHTEGGEALARSVGSILASRVEPLEEDPPPARAPVAPASMTATAAPDLTEPGAAVAARPAARPPRRLALALAAAATLPVVGWSVWPASRSEHAPAAPVTSPASSTARPESASGAPPADAPPAASEPAAEPSASAPPASRGAARVRPAGVDLTTASASAPPAPPTAAKVDPLDALGPRK